MAKRIMTWATTVVLAALGSLGILSPMAHAAVTASLDAAEAPQSQRVIGKLVVTNPDVENARQAVYGIETSDGLVIVDFAPHYLIPTAAVFLGQQVEVTGHFVTRPSADGSVVRVLIAEDVRGLGTGQP